MLTNMTALHREGLLLVAVALAGGVLAGACREPSAGGQTASSEAVAQTRFAQTQAAPGRPAPPTAPVRRQTLRRCVPAVGSFRARQMTRMGPQVSGRVQAVLVDAGDHVHKGDLLVQLDPAFFEIEVQQNQAAVAAAQAALTSATVELADAEREMKRQLDMYQKGASSTKERDDAVGAHDRAAANRAEKQAKLEEAVRKLEYSRERLKETRILAPYDGAVTARLVDVGEPATTMPLTQLVELQDVEVLYLEFSLPQELRETVAIGTPIEFAVEGVRDGAGCGTVAVVFPALDEATRSFRCRAIVENGERKYQPGALVRVGVVVEEARDALAIPRTAVSQTVSGWQVWVVMDGNAVARAVQLGLVTEDWVEVLGGLSEGDRVVVAAGDRQ